MEDIGLGEPVLLQTLRAHRSEVTCADVDVTGARLVTGSGDRTLRLWRWAAGQGWEEVAAVRDAHRYGVTCGRWSPLGALLCSGGVDGAARVWCGRSLAARRVLAAPAAAAARAACWAGGGRLLVGHDDGALCVWNVPRAALLARHVAHEGSLQAVAVIARNALLLTACTEGVLKVFNLNDVCNSGLENECSPSPLTWIDSAHDLGVLCADAAEVGGEVATGGHDALVRVWCAADSGQGLQERCSLAGHAAAVTALRWAREGLLLASASLDRTARLWLPSTAVCLHVLHAHPRYLTCVSIDQHLRYIITGSNDKSVRMFALRPLTLADELQPPCNALEHFGLGDLEGIGPVEEESAGDTAEFESGAQRVWCEDAHVGAINCVATHGPLVVTASSDGTVKVFRWSDGLSVVHCLDAHEYPALAVSVGAAGALLLSASLDGTAKLWDVQMGCQLRSLCAGVRGSVEGEGGGGVRDARVSPHRPSLLLLAADDGVAPLWCLADSDPDPTYIYSGDGSAMTCCAWSACGRMLATGAASGELRVFTPPPRATLLYHHADAHDMGVQSCDFLADGSTLGVSRPAHPCLLATAGADALIKIWLIELDEDEASASVRLVRQLEAHGGGVTSVRWQPAPAPVTGALLASAGADRWVRVWRLQPEQNHFELNLSAVCAVSEAESRGALAVALLGEQSAHAEQSGALLAVGTLGGELSLWRLPRGDECGDDDEGSDPRFWGEAGVVRWLKEYVIPGCCSSGTDEAERRLQRRARARRVCGARLLDDRPDVLMTALFDEEDEELLEEVCLDESALRERLAEELKWLRRSPPPIELEQSAPHALLCPLSHRLMREPARAADGLSYDRAALAEFFLAADGAISPVSGRRLSNARVSPNYALREKLRSFLAESGH
ncbi:WD repeat, SAM and U-box domain-containing protein 1-like isoform X2 [Plodia interpunctella]|uniref:WD repeat, SAM and U-box domain-containing protein 1-like isoform X2 n=1 Tax=Plodia interpunctella TaxID=58824 RepID=UPI0023687939|nr:WD repeat, SAM and U-box domain-containing protein 1-like isoform X2 [Plodia interpunctella]